MNKIRRIAIACALTLPVSLAVMAADPVKLGLLEDQSGNFSLAVIPKIHATQLAIDEINAKGGIMGRPIKLTITTPSLTTPSSRNLRAA